MIRKDDSVVLLRCEKCGKTFQVTSIKDPVCPKCGNITGFYLKVGPEVVTK